MANRAINNRQKLSYKQRPVMPQPLPVSPQAKKGKQGKRSKPPLPAAGKSRST